MKPPYVIWSKKMVANACVLDPLTGVEADWQLRKGYPRQEGFPAEATFRMNPDFPNNTVMPDSLANINLFIVGSLKLVEFLKARGLEGVEYLPVNIQGPKKKVVSTEYSIVHPINPIDCLDIPKCKPSWDSRKKEAIEQVKKLVLDDAKVAEIPPQRQLFRPLYFHRVILVSRELAGAIDQAGFTGIGWQEFEDFRGR